MLQIDQLTYRIGNRVLLEGAGVNLPDGHRVGLVGRNGTGKTTLLRLIQREIEPDKGTVRVRERAVMGSVAQQAPTGRRTPLEMVLSADQERHRLLTEAESAVDPSRISEIHTRLADIDAHTAPARAASILAGLGFDEAAQNSPLDTFSGGWQMRVALASSLFANPDLLLLDEPTNHLDFEATLWFERFLAAYRNTAIVVSHDRSLLNRSVDHILHLENRQLKLYRGTYDTFERTHREQHLRQTKLSQRQSAQRQRIEKFVERFRYKATKAKQAQSRIKALARMEPIATLVEQRTAAITFPSPQSASPPLLVLQDAAVGYEVDTPVLSNLNLRLDPGDRIALLGANGNGKSTLARLVSGRLELQQGRRTAHRKFSVGYFAQHQLEELDGEETPLVALGRLMPSALNKDIRTRLGTFGFGELSAETPIHDLSGGEKARLLLAFAGYAAPQLLVLDEPTNHLDVDARESLVQAINEYEGAVLLITHDRHFVDLCADHLWIVANSTVTPFDGTLDDYERRTLDRISPRTRKSSTPDSLTDKNTGADKKSETEKNSTVESITSDRKDARKLRADRRTQLAPYRRAIAKAESRMELLGAERREIEKTLSQSTTYQDGSHSPAELLKRLAEVEHQIAEAEHQWISVHEAMGADCASGSENS
jgi:ATP-binding cassette subfamily F protein 3